MFNMPKLSRAFISRERFKHPRLTLPPIDYRNSIPRIVHLSVGNFARSHLANYTDMLSRGPTTSPWAISSVSFTHQGDSLNAHLAEQDFLYTLLEQGRRHSEAKIIGSIVEGLMVKTQLAEVLKRIDNPNTEVVSLTITESGYPIEKTTSGFRFSPPPSLTHDLAYPLTPHSAPGIIVEGLRRRIKNGVKPFIVLSCDNIQGNGDAARAMVVGFAQAAHGKELAQQIEESVSFPNSMVDRITPRTTQDHIQFVEREFGYSDAVPVPCEPFSQWVIEELNTGELPPWDLVGAQVTRKVHEYETVKLRMLNAGHSALGYIGYLAGHLTIHEIAQNEYFNSYLSGLLKKEVIPYISAPQGMSLTLYHDSVLERFSNPSINDQTLRICSDGSGKLPKFIIPSLKSALECDGEIQRLCLCIAAWARFVLVTTHEASLHELDDPMAGLLKEKASVVSATNNVKHFLELGEIFDNLSTSTRFIDTTQQAFVALCHQDPQKVAQRFT